MLIYLITNKINGKVYVGRTVRTLETRWQEHLKEARWIHNVHLYFAINKYGEQSFDVRVLGHANSENEMNELETFWIIFFQSYNKKFGYNKTLGGEGTTGLEISEETRERMRAAKLGKKRGPSPLKGRKNPGVAQALLGRVSAKKGKSYGKNLKPSNHLGKTYQELYGLEKAAEIRRRQSLSMLGRPSKLKGRPRWTKTQHTTPSCQGALGSNPINATS